MLDFTKSERQTVVFLLVCFGLGMVIKSYRYFHQAVPVSHATNLLSAAPAAGRHRTQEEGGASHASEKGLRINRASLEELENIPGVGPVIGKRILEYRVRNGGFRSLDELMKVRGIGRKSYEKMAPFLAID